VREEQPSHVRWNTEFVTLAGIQLSKKLAGNVVRELHPNHAA
jgi:hypothetical protein